MKVCITEEDYLEALKVVEAYEKQLQYDLILVVASKVEVLIRWRRLPENYRENTIYHFMNTLEYNSLEGTSLSELKERYSDIFVLESTLEK